MNTESLQNETAKQKQIPRQDLSRLRLDQMLDQVKQLAGRLPQQAYVDRGCQWHGVNDSNVLLCGAVHNLCKVLRCLAHLGAEL